MHSFVEVWRPMKFKCLLQLLNITMFLLDMDKYIKCMMSYILIIIIQKLMR